MKWLHEVERLALRAVAPRRAARSLRLPVSDNDSDRPLCAGGAVAARPLPPPNGQAIAVSGCALVLVALRQARPRGADGMGRLGRPLRRSTRRYSSQRDEFHQM